MSETAAPEHTIPVFDLREQARQPDEFARCLGRAYRQWGFVGVQQHGVPDAVIEHALDAAEALFALPAATKLQYAGSPGGARGYTPFAREVAKGAAVHDLKEFWHVGRELAAPRYAQLQPNIWPQEQPAFRAAALTLYAELERVGQQLLQALARYLDLPADWFAARTDQGNSILRVLHYPPLPDEPPAGSLRAAAHEDINLITLLVGSRQSGLEIQSRQGDWVPVSLLPGTIVVNIGDILQRLTNGLLPSTTHRVVNPTGPAARVSRYSVPFFLHPNPDMDLSVLPQCVSADNPQRYAPITAHEFLQERLREIGLL
ncbi:isopenicillin N synthase family oxygenase [Natronospirillum operosum]|uniref:2-oxoglutarate-dependent ethylene/succinate-forming enzyme n=1 Tax=Natronospirillum operosum TaxID=2759953 RepID=A0A4Z0W969_9GAMM|nr:2-oxoglutarate and iron-dependent oxygenase domain-containing protein [Natronospirillum operosum]TGG90641.1 isopenicillin N synthase family oxygenase [Natronospirillum operosum]